MRNRWIKKLLVFILFAVMTSMLITVDREASIMNNREPWTELRVTRIDQAYFHVSFLGHSHYFRAEPVERMFSRLRDVTLSKNDENLYISAY